MASMVLRGVTIRYADLRVEKEGAVFCRLHLQADLSRPVMDDMGWDEIPDCVTSPSRMTGALAGRTLSLVPNDKDLKRHGFDLECNDLGDFVAVPQKNGEGAVTGHRLNCIARSLEVSAISKVEAYCRLIGEGHAQMTVSYEKQESLNFDAGTSTFAASNEDEKQEANAPLFDQQPEDEPPVEGEVVNLASAVEVAGSSAKLKAEKKQRKAKTADSLPSAPGDGEGHGAGILRHLSLDEGGVQATIDVLDEDGVLSWRISVAMPAIFQGGVDWARGQSTEPPLGISQAIVDAAESLDDWATGNGSTEREVGAYTRLSQWAQTVQREALTGGAR